MGDDDARDELDARLDELKRESATDEADAAVMDDLAEGELAEMVEADDVSSGLLSFYDRLRDRVLEAVERRGGKLGPAAVRALMLVPDVFILLVRLSLDRQVPASARAMIGGALIYFVVPVDLLPEAFVGGAGYLDDLVLATAVLAHTFSGELEPYARRHWSGPEDLRKVLSDVASAAEGLLGANLYDRMRRMLARRGVKLDDGDDGGGAA